MGRFAGAAIVVVQPLLIVSCASTYRSMTVAEKRQYLVDLEARTLEELIEVDAEARKDLDAAVGYAVFSNAATKVPIVGTGEGIGVVVNAGTDERTYLRVQRFDVGGGLGVRKYRLVMFFFEEAEMNRLATGKLELGAGIEAGAGASGGAGPRNEKRALYQLSGEGVSATWTVRVIKYSVLDLER